MSKFINSTNIEYYSPDNRWETVQFDTHDEHELAELFLEFLKENNFISIEKGKSDYETGVMINESELEDYIAWLAKEFGRSFAESIKDNPEVIIHYYKACHDYNMGMSDADDYAWLNTLFRYDIGAERALDIIRWYYENYDSTLQDSITVNSRETLKSICEMELGLNLDFSHWPKTEPKCFEYGFKADEFYDYEEE